MFRSSLRGNWTVYDDMAPILEPLLDRLDVLQTNAQVCKKEEWRFMSTESLDSRDREGRDEMMNCCEKLLGISSLSYIRYIQ